MKAQKNLLDFFGNWCCVENPSEKCITKAESHIHATLDFSINGNKNNLVVNFPCEVFSSQVETDNRIYDMIKGLFKDTFRLCIERKFSQLKKLQKTNIGIFEANKYNFFGSDGSMVNNIIEIENPEPIFELLRLSNSNILKSVWFSDEKSEEINALMIYPYQVMTSVYVPLTINLQFQFDFSGFVNRLPANKIDKQLVWTLIPFIKAYFSSVYRKVIIGDYAGVAEDYVAFVK